MKRIVALSFLIITSIEAGGVVLEQPYQKETQLTKKSSFYLGGGASLVSARASNLGVNFLEDKEGQDRLGNIFLLAGYNWKTNLAFEARVTTTIAKRNFTQFTGFSLFVKPKYNYDNLTLYTLIGAGYISLDKYKGSNVKIDKFSFQLGLGAEYTINQDWSLFADYTLLARGVKGVILNAKKADLDSFNFGIIKHF